MVKVITYGTYDLLHYGHIRLLERARALGDYLIVGVTSDCFDRSRGKINVQQTLIERIEAVKATGLADEIVVEEYEGQKIDDIRRLGIDIFTVGSDWEGHFDYLNEYCRVIYLDRTQGISSSEIRSENREIRLGLVGEAPFLNKFERESHYVNGVKIVGLCSSNLCLLESSLTKLPIVTEQLDILLNNVDALYVISSPPNHYRQIKKALEYHKHVLCESPIALSKIEYEELRKMAERNNCILTDAIRTSFSAAYHQMLLLVKSGVIGDVVSVDSICTSLRNVESPNPKKYDNKWNSICSWGPVALLPILQILGMSYKKKYITTKIEDENNMYDTFTKIAFVYDNSVASLKVGNGAKSEGELIISGTKGYVYVPAPWWKTDYFEIRYENPSDNKRYFFQLDGEGIRNELVAFVKAIETGNTEDLIDLKTSLNIISIIEDYYNKVDFIKL